MELAAELTEAVSTAVVDAVVRKFESTGLAADILKKLTVAVESQPLHRAKPPSPPPVPVSATVIGGLSLDEEQEQVLPEEQGELPPSSSLNNLFKQETRKRNRASQVTRSSTNSAAQGPSRAVHPFKTTLSRLGHMRSLLSMAIPESGSEAVRLASKRGRGEAVDLFTLQEPTRPLKRLRCPRGSGTQDESERPQSSRHLDAIHCGHLEPDSVDSFVASYSHTLVADSREQGFDEDAPSDSSADADADADADTGADGDSSSDSDVEMDPGKPSLQNVLFATQEPLYTSNVLNTHSESERTLRSNIRGAMQQITSISGTCEKSRAQMLGILLVLQVQTDTIITIRTGGGKSMLWMVPLLLKEDVRFLVVCPYRVLLEEQCRKAQDANIRAFNYTHSKHIPPEVQILFLQVEHIGSKRLDM
ncbi:hypothetical protein JVT61DRAFT_6726 [Boletus reticuloceps]|uniref:DEAD/DEAH-box helicase domain-containing protein n=1 Tax=Boletus reticuloceps TaxID=495285 RepID=A0A8I2YKW0_9AGAM|nr:hypothetical protein JVT61DRAFT_6726 [Boletus reticuloceps]